MLIITAFFMLTHLFHHHDVMMRLRLMLLLGNQNDLRNCSKRFTSKIIAWYHCLALARVTQRAQFAAPPHN